MRSGGGRGAEIIVADAEMAKINRQLRELASPLLCPWRALADGGILYRSPVSGPESTRPFAPGSM
jgi:hypothetical protein